MDAIFEEASARFDVPVNLLKAVAKAESGFNPNAVSKAGAIGVDRKSTRLNSSHMA